MARAFIDTNVLVYANDADDPDRRDVAVHLIADLARRDEGVISTQVLVEYGAVAFRKLLQPPADIDAQMAFFAGSLEVVVMTPPLVRRAVAIAAGGSVSYFDALVLAAAEDAGCAVLYSEDLNAGQSYAGIRVVDPFAASQASG